MTVSDIGTLGLLTTAGLTTAFFAYIYATKRRLYLLIWACGWCVLALHYAIATMQPLMGASSGILLASQLADSAAALLFLYSSCLYANARIKPEWIAGAATVLTLWVLAYQFLAFTIPPGYGTAAVFVAVAWVFWQESRRQQKLVDFLLALTFLCWAPLLVLMIHFNHANPGSLPEAAALGSAPQLFAAVLMVMAIHEEERQRVERNILGLANLNLSTSGFVSGEIKKTLSQALDRILNVAHFPAGVLFLEYGGARGLTASVSVGLDESFCRVAEQTRLDEYLIGLIARMAGLKIFRDFDRDPQWTAAQDEEFARFQQLAIEHGMRTVTAISLQAKDQPFGVLLLGTPENKRFSQAELRLLLALGHQVAMAVENSYLIQHESQRSADLNVLNEIGRTLSSTLDPDTLFEKIFSALQSMFDVNNFAIVLHEEFAEQIDYELDIADGIRLPKYKRAMAKGLAEYILRTGEPLLIRGNLQAEAAQLGIEPLRQAESFCGVPLTISDRTVGAMLAFSADEGAYDREHLDILRVLAAEASIAIENARMFRAEQAKSRHLALLNNISRHAISTLNPDEMLANIVEQLEKGLSFDHIGIGVLDYASKEIVLHAESGRRRGALGRRVALGANLLGAVARSGQAAILRTLDGSPEQTPVLNGSSSAVALPLFFADQLHGVFYVETAEVTDFSDEEILLLHTLSDVISGALHNALSFQKAQAQAITDGLTGIKTHRFFMEALSSEWKRSTRAGRMFSVVLIDLDRFKFVNDFHGHLEGDLVLTRVAQLLEQMCRRSDVVARYGGDEFVILMPETAVEQAGQLAQKLCAGLFGDSLLREKNITASVGVAAFPANGSTPQELIQMADASMYLSKHQGGNAVSSASQFDSNETKKWKQDVLEAYLGITLKRLFSTGPEAYLEIRTRLEQFAQSIGLEADERARADAGGHGAHGSDESSPIPVCVMDTISSLALAVDAKDHFTNGHSQKVADYAAMIAEKLGLGAEEVEQVHLGGLLHDVGKVGIPAAVLNKNGPLDPDEWETMKEHVLLGDQLLASLHTVGRIRGMIRHHHEMFDGSGYPEGLAGAQIPLGARIVAIADAYDTITSERVYKKARPSSAALAELERCAGTQFDPKLVKLFLEALGELPQSILEAEAVPARSTADREMP